MTTVTPVSRDDVMSRLATVQDPELFRDIVSLGMVKNLEIDGGNITVDTLNFDAGSSLVHSGGVLNVNNAITYQPTASFHAIDGTAADNPVLNLVSADFNLLGRDLTVGNTQHGTLKVNAGSTATAPSRA